MSDTDDTPMYDSRTGELLEQPEPDAKGVRDLRAAASRGEKARAENEGLKREMAFMKAGIDTESKAGKLLLKAYDGDLTDISALKAEGESLGALVTPPAPAVEAPANAATPQDAAALAQRGQVASGAPPSSTVTQDKDPYVAAKQGFDQRILSGDSTENAGATAFHDVFAAFDSGDTRVQYRNLEARDSGQDRPG